MGAGSILGDRPKCLSAFWPSTRPRGVRQPKSRCSIGTSINCPAALGRVLFLGRRASQSRSLLSPPTLPPFLARPDVRPSAGNFPPNTYPLLSVWSKIDVATFSELHPPRDDSFVVSQKKTVEWLPKKGVLVSFHPCLYWSARWSGALGTSALPPRCAADRQEDMVPFGY